MEDKKIVIINNTERLIERNKYGLWEICLDDKDIIWLENLTKHNNDFKKVCSKCGEELSEYSILEEGVCNRCSAGMPNKPIIKS